MMNQTELIEIAVKCGADSEKSYEYNGEIIPNYFNFSEPQLIAFAQEIRNRTIDECVILGLICNSYSSVIHNIRNLKSKVTK